MSSCVCCTPADGLSTQKSAVLRPVQISGKGLKFPNLQCETSINPNRCFHLFTTQTQLSLTILPSWVHSQTWLDSKKISVGFSAAKAGTGLLPIKKRRGSDCEPICLTPPLCIAALGMGWTCAANFILFNIFSLIAAGKSLGIILCPSWRSCSLCVPQKLWTSNWKRLRCETEDVLLHF